jgi:hypothetical protein
MRDTGTQCAICVEKDRHSSTGLHRYTSWAELRAAHATQPSEPAGLAEARYVAEWRPY